MTICSSRLLNSRITTPAPSYSASITYQRIHQIWKEKNKRIKGVNLGDKIHYQTWDLKPVHWPPCRTPKRPWNLLSNSPSPSHRISSHSKPASKFETPHAETERFKIASSECSAEETPQEKHNRIHTHKFEENYQTPKSPSPELGNSLIHNHYRCRKNHKIRKRATKIRKINHVIAFTLS